MKVASLVDAASGIASHVGLSGRRALALRVGIGLVLLLCAPFALGDYWAYQLALYLLYACASVGVGLCWGQGGFLSLGHALFFGLSAYLSGFALIHFEGAWWLWLLMPVAALASGLLAYAIGRLVFRSLGESGPYFSMIMLALSLLAFQVATTWQSVTGGFNGLSAIPSLPGIDSYTANYYVAAGAIAVVLAIGGWLLAAPTGVLLRALAGNERRAALLGFDTNHLKAAAFGVSGLFAGIGGALYAPQQGLVTPQLCGFLLSADLVIWAAVGGRGRLLGPVLGTLLVGALASELKARFVYWEVLVAALFIVVVLLFPQGLLGLLHPLRRWLWPMPSPTAGMAAPARLRAPDRDALIEVDTASVQRGSVRILQALTLTLRGPGIFCLIGPNGAGKTSAFNLVTGELPAQHGRVRIGSATGSATTTAWKVHRIARLGVSRKLQVPAVFAALSVGDNLAIALWSGRARKTALLDLRLLHWRSPLLAALTQRYPFLADRQRLAGELAHGEKQVLELCMALLTEPDVLLLDEPCAGLSPEETAQVIATVRW
ncbi:MAG: transporter ATP-binding protein, partial [Rhizobacter sp.]|nr:transporter ATP-binding protein [Rhizobacter sp.]